MNLITRIQLFSHYKDNLKYLSLWQRKKTHTKSTVLPWDSSVAKEEEKPPTCFSLSVPSLW